MHSAAWGDGNLFGGRGKSLKDRFGHFGEGKDYYSQRSGRGKADGAYDGSSDYFRSKSGVRIEKQTTETL